MVFGSSATSVDFERQRHFDWFTGQVPGGAQFTPGGKGLAKSGIPRKGTRFEVGFVFLGFWWSPDCGRPDSILKND